MPRKPDLTKKERYNDPFPSRLRELIRERDVTQEQLKDVLSLSKRQSVTSYVDGETLPTIDKLVAIADYFGVTPDFLLGFSDAKTNDIEVQAVCDRTGLSVKAVKELQELPGWAAKWADSDIRSMLNLVIENYAFELCNGLQRIESAKNNALSAISLPVSSPPNTPTAKLDALQDSQKELELALFNFTEICRQIADEFDSYNVLLDCKKAYYEVIESIPLEAKWEGSENGQHFETAEN